MDDAEILDWIFAAAVTAGIDAGLRLAADLRGEHAEQRIQLEIAYAPEPPFDSGTPTAPPAVLSDGRASVAGVTARREQTARRIAARLGVALPPTAAGSTPQTSKRGNTP